MPEQRYLADIDLCAEIMELMESVTEDIVEWVIPEPVHSPTLNSQP